MRDPSSSEWATPEFGENAHSLRGTLDQLLQLTRELAGAIATVTHSGSNFVEVAAAGVTKALALEQVCRDAGVHAGQVIAFGDMPNDLPMLHWAGYAVAVANAHPEVLSSARTRTLSNDADGVAHTLEQLIAARVERNSSY